MNLGRQRQGKEEGRTMTGYRLYPDPATMGFYQPATYQEAQSGPVNALKAGVFQSLERLKELGLVVKRYAYTLVTNPDNQLLFLWFGKDSYLASLGRILNCVYQKIIQDTFQSQLVSMDRRQPLGEVHYKLVG
jgi:hypothetical protein